MTDNIKLPEPAFKVTKSGRVFSHPDEVDRTGRALEVYTADQLRAAVLAEREECAKVCEAIEGDRWALYKGRPPYTGKELGRAAQITQGESDGAGLCAAAIRARGKQ